MRAAQSIIALCALGASAATLPAVAEVETREASAGTWYLVSFEGNCGSFGCNYDYAIFGGENAVPGAPAFALRCNTWEWCTSVFPGSDASGQIVINQGPVTVSQTFTSGGKTYKATATVPWDGLSVTALTIPVNVTVS
ncbi:hypothetical protein O1611_g4611 [Lasiodiplodia mahajangana]|uniref:Uncharacterized protein n=1 Tax=Lasiodiplodia mahajangana TaxID=1108764 RepID=A0ACC2JND9_9PEZI|nr:hypothetical protein O1611_g4611 [Lasiodiplodia mahajangana]